MLDLIDTLHILDDRVHNAMPVFKERRKVSAANMTIFIDRGRQHNPAMLLIPGGIVGSAAKK